MNTQLGETPMASDQSSNVLAQINPQLHDPATLQRLPSSRQERAACSRRAAEKRVGLARPGSRWKKLFMKRSHGVLACTLVFTFAAGGASAQHLEQDKKAMTAISVPALATPSAIVQEHEHLHHQLADALASGGETAVRARAVADVLEPHFKTEEAYAMPPLGLLGAIANDQPLSDEQRQGAIKMARELRAHYEQMIQEHQQIQAALDALASAARQEHKPEALAFAETLMLHAQNEEQVLYPTTLLIGRYLELQQTGGQ